MRVYKEKSYYYVEVERGNIVRYNHLGQYRGGWITTPEKVDEYFKNHKYFNISNIEELKNRK